jgi:hypothetical protein
LPSAQRKHWHWVETIWISKFELLLHLFREFELKLSKWNLPTKEHCWWAKIKANGAASCKSLFSAKFCKSRMASVGRPVSRTRN